MSKEHNVITINLLERKYNIKCPAGEAADLRKAAEYINDQMKGLRQTSNMTSMDQLAVVTSLNIAQELFELKNQKNNYINMMNQRLKDLEKRIENFLVAKEGVEV